MTTKQLSILIGSIGFALAACAGGSSGTAPAGETSASTRAPRGVPAPAGTPLAKVNLGMSETEVREAAGSPTSQTTYPTGKMWIPFYFGPTHQTDYKYKGQGRVVFAHNRWSGVAKVIRVDYDPNEDGA